MPDGKNAEKKSAMLAALAEGCTWEEAAERVGVNESTLRRWCSADPDLARQAAKARDAADDLVEAVTFRNCIDPDPAHNTLRMFWLKSRRRGVYAERVEHDNKGDIRITVKFADELRDHPAPAASRPGEDPPGA